MTEQPPSIPTLSHTPSGRDIRAVASQDVNTLATGALADVRALLTYGERLDQALAETQLLREFAAQAQASMHTLHAVLATEQTQRQRAQAEIVSLKAHHAAEVAAAHEQMVQGELVRALEPLARSTRTSILT